MATTEPPGAAPPTAEAGVATPRKQIVKPKRGGETAFDMVRSLGLIGVVIAVTLIFVPGLVHPGKSDRYPAIDFTSYLSGFHEVTGKAALAPTPVPAGWSATAGSLTGPTAAEHLHIGFAVPGSQYAGLEESVGPMSKLVSTVLGAPGAKVTGTTQIAGGTWQSRMSSRGELAISRRINGVNVVITGSATGEQLELLATSLH